MAKREQIVEMIRQRAAVRGLDPDFAVRVAELESSLNPNARNRRSSASGLYQLTDARRREIGAPLKRQLSVDEQIEYGLTSLSMAEKYLEERLERKPQPFEVYAAHFSGPAGSVKVLKADEKLPIDRVLSTRAIRANPDLKGKTTGQVITGWKDKFGDVGQKAPPEPTVAKEPAPKELYPTDQPDWEAIGRSQLTAQAPVGPMAGEPVAMMAEGEPVAMMAEGGMVDEDDDPFHQHVARLVGMARTDADYRRINKMLAAGPQGYANGGMIGVGYSQGDLPVGYQDGGEAKKGPSAKEMLDKLDEEPTAEELEQASKPAFGRYAASGKGRKQGRVSEALQSGEAQREFLKGMTMAPQNLVGAPVDIATMLMRPLGYRVEKPVMGSDWLKEKSRAAGLAFQEPQDPTLRAFFTAGDISSNLINPAGATRTAVRGYDVANRAINAASIAAADKAVQAVTGNPQATALKVLEEAGTLAPLSRITRPPGGGVAAMPDPGQLSESSNLTGMAGWVSQGMRSAEFEARGEKADAMRNFWKSKAANYVSRQMGTSDDPIFKQILAGNLTSPEMSKVMPGYMVRGAAEGKTRVDPATGREIFYPKDPQALEDLTRAYDKATGIKPMVFVDNPNFVSPEGRMTAEGKMAASDAREKLVDQLIVQGARPGLINIPELNMLQPKPGGGLISSIYENYVPEKFLKAAEDRAIQLGLGLEPGLAGKDISGAMARAMATSEPIYDMRIKEGLQDILNPQYINEYLTTLSPKEINKIRFEDAVKGSAKFHLKKFEYENLQSDIRAGKRVNEKFFTQGVSAPLLQFEEGPFAGFAWKRLETPESTVGEGAYVGHSVGGYALGGPGYGKEKMERFTKGLNQVYSLRDNRNRPVTTIEVVLDSKGAPVVQQIKGNGRATGNTTAENYDQAVHQFLRDYLKPVAIAEDDKYLTPLLQQYRTELAEERSRKATEQHLRELYPNAD